MRPKGKQLAVAIIVSKGVLAKDKTPYAPATMHFVDARGFQCPVDYTVEALLDLLIGDVVAIKVIDKNNREVQFLAIEQPPGRPK